MEAMKVVEAKKCLLRLPPIYPEPACLPVACLPGFNDSFFDSERAREEDCRPAEEQNRRKRRRRWQQSDAGYAA